MADHFDVIVVGLGVMGSATCLELARRGLAVLGLEQFTPGHELGSSHGQTRVIRKAYFEDPRYVPMARRSMELWRELEADSGSALLYPAGCLNMGPADHPAILGVRRSVQEHGLPHEFLSGKEIRSRWPVFTVDKEVAVYEADAGILVAESCVASLREIALRCGAELRFDTKVKSWQSEGKGVRVQTRAESLEADRLILTTGPWLPVIAPDLSTPLAIERQVQLWFAPDEPGAYSYEKVPIFIHFDGDRSCYGIPIVPADPPFDKALKIARHHGGTVTTADTVDRRASSEDELDVRGFIRKTLPSANGPLVASQVCLYTNTPDSHFVIGPHPRHEHVLVAGGFSGHGFKFAPLVGEMLAGLVTSHSR